MQIKHFLRHRSVLRYIRWSKNVFRCANLLKFGGDEEDRTPDPLLARQVLSQLSYTPKFLLILRQDFLGIHMYCLRRLSLSKQKLLCLASFVAILGCLPFLCQIVHLNDRRVLCVHKGVQMCKMVKNGGPKWTRTTDLTLIRRAL